MALQLRWRRMANGARTLVRTNSQSFSSRVLGRTKVRAPLNFTVVSLNANNRLIINEPLAIIAAIGMALLAISMLIPRITVFGVIQSLIFIVLAVEFHAIIPAAYEDNAKNPIFFCLFPWYLLAGRIGWIVYHHRKNSAAPANGS